MSMQVGTGDQIPNGQVRATHHSADEYQACTFFSDKFDSRHSRDVFHLDGTAPYMEQIDEIMLESMVEKKMPSHTQ